MKKIWKRGLSLFLAAVICMGVLPGSVFAGLAPEFEDNQIFNYITLSGAGAAQMDDWAMGEYLGVQEKLEKEGNTAQSEFFKTRLMIRAMHFNPRDDNPISFYVPVNAAGSRHELTLYGMEDVDPASVTISGVTVTGEIERHVFGDVSSDGYDERLYWYTVPVFVPKDDVTMQIYVSGDLYATLPVVHVNGVSPAALFTTMQVYDYEEGEEPDTIRSMTLRVSGFGLSDDPLFYTYQWENMEAQEEEEYTYYSVDAKEVSAPDEFGYRLVRFEFDDGATAANMIWGRLLFDNDYTAFFFGKSNHLVNTGTEAKPVYSFRTNYAYDDDPYFYLGGYDAMVPTPYYCIFKDPSDTGAAPEVMPELTVSGTVLPDGRISSQLPYVYVYQDPGSYLDGEWRLSADGRNWQEWYAAGDTHTQIMLTLADTGKYGDYTAYAQFRKEGLKTVTLTRKVNYNDGTAPAPTRIGVFDLVSGAEVSRQGDAAVIKTAESRRYLVWAEAPEGLILNCDFGGSGGGTMAWNAENSRYEATFAIGEIPGDAACVRVWTDGESEGYTKDSAALELPLVFLEGGYLNPLYAPVILREVKKDETGKAYYAVAPGATLTGVFEAAVGAGRSHRMTLSYLTSDGETKTVSAAAVGDGNRQFTAKIPLPSDTDRLGKVAYELVRNGETEERVEYDLSDYRVYARSHLTGIPEEYVGTMIELKDGKTVRSYFVTKHNYSFVPLGDLPSGGYEVVITGASGHIAQSAVTVERGEDIALSGLPALGSVKVVTTGFNSSLNGEEINPPASVTLNFTTPDGTKCKLLASSGETRTQIPVGSSGQAKVSFDASASDEISACTADKDSFTVAGDETLTFAYKPFTFRTISGSVWGVKTYPSGFTTGLAPKPATILVTQEINRGGSTETVTFSTTVGYGPSNNWSVLCYDNFPAKVEVRSFTWDTQRLEVTDNGNVNLGQVTMTYGGEMLIQLVAQIQTPASVKEDGTPYFSASDSVTEKVDSGFLSVGSISTGGKTYYSNSGLFETVIIDGQAFLRIHEGLVQAYEDIYVCAAGTTTMGDASYSVSAITNSGANNLVKVNPDETGTPTAVFTATVSTLGGQFRATVVDDYDSDYVGFLAYPAMGNICLFAYGRGELTVPYTRWEAGGSDTILAFMVPEKDAEDMAALLGSNPKKLWNLLPENAGWSDYFFRQEYGGRLLYRTVSAHANSTVYLEDLKPAKPMITGALDPYLFTCRYELTDSPDTIRMVGTLTKRYPDQVDQDKIRSMTLYAADSREDTGELAGTVPFTISDLGNGQSLITAELPLSYAHLARFRLEIVYWHDSVTEDRGNTTLEFARRDPVKIFSLANPGSLYITDQLDAQGLTAQSPERQAAWTLNLSLRTFLSKTPEENRITVYDNGTPIYSYDAGAGAQNYLGLGSTDRLRVRLTDNLTAGIHVVWANREVGGETISTEPVVFTLLEGRENNSVRVTNLTWTHWNHRIGWDEDHPDRMYFDNLSDLAGKNVWIWPGKKHYMQFRVENATSAELDGVNLVYDTLCLMSNRSYTSQDPKQYGYFRSLKDSNYAYYLTITRAIPCKLISENENGNWSIWGIDEAYLGYLQGFEFEFDYNAAIDKQLAEMTTEELSALESEAFYKANGLGEVPDGLKEAAAVNSMSEEQLKEAVAGLSEASEALKGLDLKITEDSDRRMKMELKTPTKELSEYAVTMEKGGTMELPDILMLMEKEREEGSQNPAEAGWDVTWAEFETLQGSTLIRIASYDGMEAGRHALKTHTTYYITKSVADALSGSGTGKLSAETPLLADLTAADRIGAEDAASPQALPAGPDEGKPDHWTKQLYDGTSIVYSSGDLTDEAWKAYCRKIHLAANPDDLAGARAFADSESLIPKKLDTTMKVLGVADTVITYAKGPSGADPAGLRQLLTYVRDDRARRSLEAQIRDYESLRYDIYKQDCAMSTYSTASNFAPMGPIGKAVVFVGGLLNGVISGWSKDYNRQVYNTTLHDIQLQIKYEAVKAERLKKSFMDAEKWLRDKMDSIYGKGNWSEYALAEERKNWVLKEYPGGILKYQWKDKAPEFSVTLDPSGYVYEAVTEDTVEGVTATLYYSETEDGNYSVWTDPFGEQPNPQSTSDTGNYMWMVPVGWWKVRYEKEGYRTAESCAMSVPPIHTTVNIGLLSEEAPEAAVSVGNGEITVLFSKYMQLESLIRLFGEGSYTDASFDSSAFAVQFYGADGVSLHGTVTFPDIRANTGYKGEGYGTDVVDSDWFVRIAVFKPDDPAADLSGVTWRLMEGMVSYAGVPLSGETSKLFLIRLDPGEGLLDTRILATDGEGRVTMLPEPYRDGYDFAGWYTAAGTPVTAETVFTADTSLTARWSVIPEPEEPSYEVIVLAEEGGTASANVNSAKEGQPVTLTAIPGEGRYFKEWEVLEGDITVTDNTFVMPAGRAAVRAVFGLRGDVNGDGDVTILDYLVLARCLAGWEGYEALVDREAANLNGDSEVNAKDRMLLAKEVLG